MLGAGQTASQQIVTTQSPPHLWCAPLADSDIGGPSDNADGVSDGWDCRTPPALGTVKPVVCSNSLPEELLVQCTGRLTDVYMINWRRTPNNLRPVFEGFTQLFVNSLFKTCLGEQSGEESNGQCMFDAFLSGSILINLWGSDHSLSDFIIKLADLLSGQPLPICTFTQIQAGLAGLTCRATTETVSDQWSMPNPGQSGSESNQPEVEHQGGVGLNPFMGHSPDYINPFK